MLCNNATVCAYWSIAINALKYNTQNEYGLSIHNPWLSEVFNKGVHFVNDDYTHYNCTDT